MPMTFDNLQKSYRIQAFFVTHSKFKKQNMANSGLTYGDIF